MSSSWAALPSVHGVSRHPRISIAVQRVSQSLGHSSANKNEPDGSFPERTKCTKPRRPRPSAAGKRVSPRPAWLTERPAVRVRKDLAAFFEFFTPLHFCVDNPEVLRSGGSSGVAGIFTFMSRTLFAVRHRREFSDFLPAARRCGGGAGEVPTRGLQPLLADRLASGR